MSTIVTCACGVKIRLPEQMPAGQMRCPKCKQPLNLPAPEESVSSLSEQPIPSVSNEPPSIDAESKHAGLICPVCQTGIEIGERVTTCEACGQVHHTECWTEVQGCATYGCTNAHQTIKSQPESSPLSAWGDTKLCPVCGERIKAIALKCRYCATTFSNVDPMTAADVRQNVVNKESNQSLRTAVCVFCGVSVIGLGAPLMLLIGLVWFLPSRKRIEKLGPAYLVLGWIGLALSVLYSILMFLFVMLD